MAKSKNHTNHNQNKKAHKNGIHRPKSCRYPSLKGVDPKFRRNQKFAKHGTQKALAAERAAKAWSERDLPISPLWFECRLVADSILDIVRWLLRSSRKEGSAVDHSESPTDHSLSRSQRCTSWTTAYYAPHAIKHLAYMPLIRDTLICGQIWILPKPCYLSRSTFEVHVRHTTATSSWTPPSPSIFILLCLKILFLSVETARPAAFQIDSRLSPVYVVIGSGFNKTTR